MNKFLDFMYTIRFFFFGGMFGCIPFFLLYTCGGLTPKNNFMFYWFAICVAGYLLAFLGRKTNA
jgi:hypothetical protein